MDNIKYTIIRSSRRSVSLVIDTDANLVVRAPFRMTDRAIAEFVASKQNWIEKHLEKMRLRAAKRAEAPLFTQDEREELIRKALRIIPDHKRIRKWLKEEGSVYLESKS